VIQHKQIHGNTDFCWVQRRDQLTMSAVYKPTAGCAQRRHASGLVRTGAPARKGDPKKLESMQALRYDATVRQRQMSHTGCCRVHAHENGPAARTPLADRTPARKAASRETPGEASHPAKRFRTCSWRPMCCARRRGAAPSRTTSFETLNNDPRRPPRGAETRWAKDAYA
jgi:hypothetical protein